MPIPIEKIQVIEDEIERRHENKNGHKNDDDDDDDDTYRRHHKHAMTPPEQDFSYLKHSSHAKRSVHYDDEQMNQHEHRPFRTTQDADQSLDNVLRRRYIAHWGLPGSYDAVFRRISRALSCKRSIL